MTGAVFSSCLFGLRHLNIEACRLLGGSRWCLPKWQPIGELLLMNIPCSLCHHCPCLLQWATADSCFPSWPCNTHRFIWLRLLWSHCFALQPSACETTCAPSKSGICFRPVLWSSYTQAPLAFKAKCYPHTDELDEGLRSLTLVGNLL